MRHHRSLLIIIALVGVIGFAFGCSRGPSEEEQKQAQLQAQFDLIQQGQTVLAEARTALETTETSIEEIEAVAERRRSTEQTEQLAELQAQAQEESAAVDTAYDDFQAKLADFLTMALNELPEDPLTLEGLKIYSDESIRNAEETVAQAGDYKKAIDLLDTASGYFEMLGLELYQPLVDKKAELDDARYITEERFQAIKKRMTEDEVKEIAGVPYYLNMKEDAQRGIAYWLYPKREGGAAAIYFDKRGRVYSMKFDAVKTKVVAEE